MYYVYVVLAMVAECDVTLIRPQYEMTTAANSKHLKYCYAACFGAHVKINVEIEICVL